MGKIKKFDKFYNFRIFLIRLLEKLTTKDIIGVELAPKTMASCMVNIRKAFKVLG